MSNKVYFVKTHELPSDDSPAILLVRDGRDAMVSFAHYIEDCGVVRWSPVGQFVANLEACRQELLHGRPRFDQLLRRILTSIGRATTKRGARGQQTVPWSSLNCSSANPRARVKVHWMPYDSD